MPWCTMQEVPDLKFQVKEFKILLVFSSQPVRFVITRFTPVKNNIHGRATERYNSYDDHYLICNDRKIWKLLQFQTV